MNFTNRLNGTNPNWKKSSSFKRYQVETYALHFVEKKIETFLHSFDNIIFHDLHH
jgi:hypothetical protein